MTVKSNPDGLPAEGPMVATLVSDELSKISGTSKPEHEHIEGNALLLDKEGRIRRLPIPSTNPNDPLSFKPWEKAAVIICCCWFCKFMAQRTYLSASG